jgi:hypothetical protein
MISTRVAIIIGLVILYLSAGTNWVYFSAAGYGVNYLDISGNLQTYASHGMVFDNTTIDGEIWVALLPQLASSAALVGSVIVFAVSAVLGAVSLFRWKLMSLTGLFAIMSGVLWIWGIDIISPNVNSVLHAWLVYTGEPVSSSMYPQIGLYLTALGGFVMLVGYVLSRMEKLDYPLD